MTVSTSGVGLHHVSQSSQWTPLQQGKHNKRGQSCGEDDSLLIKPSAPSKLSSLPHNCPRLSWYPLVQTRYCVLTYYRLHLVTWSNLTAAQFLLTVGPLPVVSGLGSLNKDAKLRLARKQPRPLGALLSIFQDNDCRTAHNN